MESAGKPVMARLKEETWDLHERAEKGELEQQMIQGRLPRELYIKTLAQRYFLHRELDALLRKHRESDQCLAAVVNDDHFHTPRVEADLAYFGVDIASLKPLAATERIIAVMRDAAAAAPYRLLGIQYVLEGSTNGAKFIARVVRKAYGLEGLDGTRLLDPYGDQQRERWMGFVMAVNRIHFSEHEADNVVMLARATFQFMIELDEEIFAAA